MSQSAIDLLYCVLFGCTQTPLMHPWMATCRTKAYASQYYGVYAAAVMRLERYGRDGI